MFSVAYMKHIDITCSPKQWHMVLNAHYTGLSVIISVHTWIMSNKMSDGYDFVSPEYQRLLSFLSALFT